MVTRVQRWGNSQGLRLAKQLLREAGLAVGDDVEVALRDGVLVISPARRVRGKVSLQKLVADMPENAVAEEPDWGEPRGLESW